MPLPLSRQVPSYPAFDRIIAELNKYVFEDIADLAGVSVPTLYNWSNGKVKAPQLRTLAAVASVLGFEVTLTRISRAVATPKSSNLRLVH